MIAAPLVGPRVKAFLEPGGGRPSMAHSFPEELYTDFLARMRSRGDTNQRSEMLDGGRSRLPELGGKGDRHQRDTKARRHLPFLASSRRTTDIEITNRVDTTKRLQTLRSVVGYCK